MSYLKAFVHELRVIARRGGSSAHVAVLFAIVVGTALFVLPPECIASVMPSLFWVCGVSVMQISIRALFEEDYYSGVLEQLLIQNLLPEIILFFKILANWFCVAIPISIVAMVIDFVVLGDGFTHVLVFGAILSATLLIVNFIAAVGHALVLGGEGGLVIAQVLIFPIVVPVVVYFNLLLQALKGVVFYTYTMTLLGVGMMCLIPISIFFVLSAIKLAVEQN
ncbi:heme exporter protein CcmB [Anaplasma phagocytophilum]|uniref:CcmB family protein n=1 Tax=Anaplasma phagocytophilum str. ApWI1 TaxID=1359155 RepID=A0A0F3PX31_ANAPH|nr:heme exporter protein CcmB [Anaplasma phagocytophilum]AGR79157.1 heme exporter protein B [Anaplasma phagocytophilum str. HZ2]AGR81658.1 heme exporter protein B [Anaplasma phagocytophilum str. Dog2]KDB55259.1 cytochrome C biogenesis protein [Anaplasma phagocytophilum str. MRK]KDB55724.1 cytochrome C biogenesis protein [Anaplasma phagocytophilum str. CRT35]KJV84828.1 ccmB family protein [Anaplasma phagocytophilum str. ApWI1]